jgi:hypothetical protein
MPAKRNSKRNADDLPALKAEMVVKYFELIEDGTPHQEACRQLGVTHAQVESTFARLEDLFERFQDVQFMREFENDAKLYSKAMKENAGGPAAGGPDSCALGAAVAVGGPEVAVMLRST